MNFCDSCAKGKARVKNIKKETDTPVKKKGDVLALDISSVKYVSKGNKKFWLRLMDLHTKMKWSYFLKNKSEIADIVVNFLKHIESSKKLRFVNIRCDNAGENRTLHQTCLDKGLGITFQFTAPYTPQQNGAIERSFATSYGRMRSFMSDAGMSDDMKRSL